jgi:hypothetical protein
MLLAPYFFRRVGDFRALVFEDAAAARGPVPKNLELRDTALRAAAVRGVALRDAAVLGVALRAAPRLAVVLDFADFWPRLVGP